MRRLWQKYMPVCIVLSFMLQETRERVKLLIQLADSLVEKGHAHASAIKQWVAAVDNRYKGFSARMDKYRSVPFVTCINLMYVVAYLSKGQATAWECFERGYKNFAFDSLQNYGLKQLQTLFGEECSELFQKGSRPNCNSCRIQAE
jgi:hypothetical protein